jgi:quercetin dioxygenase-like cupin family protein
LDIDDANERARTGEAALGSKTFGAFERATHEALAQWSKGQVGSESDLGGRERVRDRLFRTLASEERFRPFYAELARELAMTIDAVRSLLHKVDEPASYQVAPIPGVQFFHFTPGQGCGFAEAGIVKLSKGAKFPRHRHVGHEINFILEGALIDNAVSYAPGALVRSAAGSEHDYVAGQKRDLLLVAGHNGITYLT